VIVSYADAHNVILPLAIRGFRSYRDDQVLHHSRDGETYQKDQLCWHHDIIPTSRSRMAVTHYFSFELEINFVECLLQLLYGLASTSYLLPSVQFSTSPFHCARFTP
jgi:hypothetical protein